MELDFTVLNMTKKYFRILFEMFQNVRNRFTIQSDIQAMAKYGLKNAVEYLRLLDAYKDRNSIFCSLASLTVLMLSSPISGRNYWNSKKNETDDIVLSDITSGWATFNKFKKKLNIESKLNQFTIDLFRFRFFL